MRTMNRFYPAYSERNEAAIVKSYDRSLESMRSFKARDKRENCVLIYVPSPGEIS